jgi:hypothetical protein
MVIFIFYGIVEKGSGLQRLALILLQFEIADRLILRYNLHSNRLTFMYN